MDIIFGTSTKGKTDKKYRKQGVVICTTPMINSNIEEPHLKPPPKTKSDSYDWLAVEINTLWYKLC